MTILEVAKFVGILTQTTNHYKFVIVLWMNYTPGISAIKIKIGANDIYLSLKLNLPLFWVNEGQSFDCIHFEIGVNALTLTLKELHIQSQTRSLSVHPKKGYI